MLQDEIDFDGMESEEVEEFEDDFDDEFDDDEFDDDEEWGAEEDPGDFEDDPAAPGF
jgi:hypothetical protein